MPSEPRVGATAGKWTVAEIAPETAGDPHLIQISDGFGSFITSEPLDYLMVCLAEFLGVKSWSVEP